MNELLKPFSNQMGKKFVYAQLNEYENEIVLVFADWSKISIRYEADEAGDVYLKTKAI